jgi:hypothetical protein
MPAFHEYICSRGHRTTTQRREDAIMCGSDCSEIARRKWGFNIGRSVPEHYNNAVGAYVNNEHDVREGLKRAAEKQFLDTGYSTTYEYIPPADVAAAGKITEEGMDTTRKRVQDMGLKLVDGNYVPQ